MWPPLGSCLAYDGARARDSFVSQPKLNNPLGVMSDAPPFQFMEWGFLFLGIVLTRNFSCKKNKRYIDKLTNISYIG
jgi:hypothetical protein